MKKLVILAVILALLSAGVALASPGTPDQPAANHQSNSPSGNYDEIERNAAKVPALEAEIERLKEGVGVNANPSPVFIAGSRGSQGSKGSQGPMGQQGLQGPKGGKGDPGSAHYVPDPKPWWGTPGFWIAVLVIVLVGFWLMARSHRPSGNYLRDPNREVAKAANAVEKPGFREIVEMSAAGDYSRETTRDATVMIVEAHSQSEIAAIMAIGHSQRLKTIAEMAASLPQGGSTTVHHHYPPATPVTVKEPVADEPKGRVPKPKPAEPAK